MESPHSVAGHSPSFSHLGAIFLVALTLVLAGCTGPAPSAGSPPPATLSSPAATPVTMSPSPSPIDTTTWIPYKSKQFGFTLKHPPGWTVEPADGAWSVKAEKKEPGGGSHEGFSAPGGDVYVTAWSTPAKGIPETLEGVAAWIEEFCRQTGGSCPGIQDRSVPLCNGRAACAARPHRAVSEPRLVFRILHRRQVQGPDRGHGHLAA